MAENVNAEVQLAAIPAAATSTPTARDPVKLIGTLSLLVIAFVFAFPVVWAALTSFKSTASVIATRYPLSLWSFFPPEPTLENYAALFTDMNFGRHLFNTALASGGQVILVVITSTLAGYAFARLRFPGREVLFALTLLTAFIPLEVILVPLYQVVSAMGLTSTYPALFLPFAAQPFGIYLMRQSFMQIPTELDDAARVDGAGTWRIFWRIAMPNVKPALATLVLIQFIWSWNAYLWPLVIMQDPNKQIVQVMLAGLKGSPNYSLDGPLFAGLTFVTVPLIVMAIVLQRHYVRGLMTSGIR
ncbi:carbohydrate ABC transporter membrane protein 2 (CUT1 family) [Aminobacter aminovorans]|uniref:sn-glycerol-3-phosphate transport system permease protein UgpE n=1 Tax=Aminobacter aminovorans TaxID=83263 RepID=A0A380WI58_AMIAI|nr:carbohydrate ABC transporter permease [Aminobacter aminovorans]TCS27087.1 carbohydrate ABC transporter membrane protein 2 (CUT1 family) [Aminobacter aminovorans]SUU87854.1 Inner membrane ABC transporter permease protein ycjP [Aminobacter aminovorans]